MHSKNLPIKSDQRRVSTLRSAFNPRTGLWPTTTLLCQILSKLSHPQAALYLLLTLPPEHFIPASPSPSSISLLILHHRHPWTHLKTIRPPLPPIPHKSSRKLFPHNNKLRRHHKCQVRLHHQQCHLEGQQIRLLCRIHLWSESKLRMLHHRLWEIQIKLLKSVYLGKEHEEEREVGRKSLRFYLFCCTSRLWNYLVFHGLNSSFAPIYLFSRLYRTYTTCLLLDPLDGNRKHYHHDWAII